MLKQKNLPIQLRSGVLFLKKTVKSKFLNQIEVYIQESEDEKYLIWFYRL